MKKIKYILYFVLVFIITIYVFLLRPISKNPKLTSDIYNESRFVNELYVSDELLRNNAIDNYCTDLYDQIRDFSKGSSKDMQITSTITCLKSLMDIYNAVMLDHPELINSYKLNGDVSNYNAFLHKGSTAFDSSELDNNIKTIQKKIDVIINNTKKMSDKDKIIYVYDYISSINFDFQNQDSLYNNSLYSVFILGKSSNNGFAKASQILFQNIGINSYLVDNGYGFLFNLVEYEGKYYIFDSSLGSYSKLDTKYDYYSGLEKTLDKYNDYLYSDSYPNIEDDNLRRLFGL